jgi:Ribbon-helix-helix protein, copG family
MPTLNPRVNVTLSPSLFDLVGHLARLQGASRSQVLRELLEAAEPALQRAVAFMQAAERAKGAVQAGFGDSLMRAQDRIEAELGKHLERVDSTTADLVEMAERVEGRRPGRPRSSGGARAGARVPNPPASNRGVKSLKGRHPEGGKQ